MTNELKGYPDENVPGYRVVSAEVHGHATSYRWQANDYVLPIIHLPEKQRKNLTASHCTMSIASIEESVKHGKKLIRHLPPEFGALFQKVVIPETNVFSTWCEINMVHIENILSEVRSRLCIIGNHTYHAVTNEKDDIDGLLDVVGKLVFQQRELEARQVAVLHALEMPHSRSRPGSLLPAMSVVGLHIGPQQSIHS